MEKQKKATDKGTKFGSWWKKIQYQKEAKEKQELVKKDTPRTEKWANKRKEFEDEIGIPITLGTIPPADVKNLAQIASNLVRDIHAGINSSGRHEIILSMMPAMLKGTRIRVERAGINRVKIYVVTDNPVSVTLFHGLRESIVAGLLIKGVNVDEFTITKRG